MLGATSNSQISHDSEWPPNRKLEQVNDFALVLHHFQQHIYCISNYAISLSTSDSSTSIVILVISAVLTLFRLAYLFHTTYFDCIERDDLEISP